jgi:assimilatory nitrate reductase electron transfer subunit
MRLKAVGLDVVTMGRTAATADSHDRVVSVHDRVARRHIEVIVRDDTLVGVTAIGAPEIAAHLSTQYDRPGMIPSDPLQLLLGTGAGSSQEAHSPTAMPAATTVCRCNGVTKGDLVHAWEGGACTVEDLAEQTLATTGCGGCTSLVCGLVDWLSEVDPPADAEARSRSARSQREDSVPVR